MDKTNDNSERIRKGTLFNTIGKLPPDQARLVYDLPQAERERIMALEGKAREAAIEALKTKPKPAAEPVSNTKAKEK